MTPPKRLTALLKRRTATASDASASTPASVEPAAKLDTAAKAEAAAKSDSSANPAPPSTPEGSAGARFGLDALLPPPPAGLAASRLVEGEKIRPARIAAADPAGGWRQRVAAGDGRTLAAAAAVFLALGTGWITGRVGGERHGAASLAAPALSELSGTREDVARLAAELRGLRGVVETLRGERDGSHDVEPLVRELSERLDRTGQENATRIGRLTEQLDRIEKTGREALRVTTAAAERSEKPSGASPSGVAPVATGKAADPSHTGSIAPAGEPRVEFDPRKVRLDGYVLRDYDDGFALIETRSGRFLEVAVGHSLPGVGRVDAIERRGRQWVVITPKGFIGER